MNEETKKPEEVKEVVQPVVAQEVVAPVVTNTPVVETPVVVNTAPLPEVAKVIPAATVEIAEVTPTIEEVAVTKTQEEAAREMIALLSENENVALAEASIQNNKLEFELDGNKYRVRKTKFSEKQEANSFRIKRFIQLLKDPDNLLEKDLKALYKSRGIDIDGMDKTLLELDTQQKSLMLDLGGAIKLNKSKPELEQYKTEIINVSNSIQGVQLEKQQLLEYSLENRVLMEIYSYMIWMISEKKVGSEWLRIWNKYEEFLDADNMELLGKVTKLGAVVVTDEMTSNLKM